MATFLTLFTLSSKGQLFSNSFLDFYKGGSFSFFGKYFCNDIVHRFFLADLQTAVDLNM